MLDLSRESRRPTRRLTLQGRRRSLGPRRDLKKKRGTHTRTPTGFKKRVIEQKQQQYFGIAAWLRGLPGIDLMTPTDPADNLPELTINSNFKDVPRLRRCTSLPPGGSTGRLRPRKPKGRIALEVLCRASPPDRTGPTTNGPDRESGQGGPLLDANGRHPIQQLGCTIWHGGQGRGPLHLLLARANDDEQKAEWEKKYHWQRIHSLGRAMLPERFLQ